MSFLLCQSIVSINTSVHLNNSKSTTTYSILLHGYISYVRKIEIYNHYLFIHIIADVSSFQLMVASLLFSKSKLPEELS